MELLQTHKIHLHILTFFNVPILFTLHGYIYTTTTQRYSSNQGKVFYFHANKIGALHVPTLRELYTYLHSRIQT